MTKEELKQELEAFGSPLQPARISEAIPDYLPHVTLGSTLFVLCSDGPVSFATVTYGWKGGNVEFVPSSFTDTEGTMALWRLGKHNIDVFDTALKGWRGE